MLSGLGSMLSACPAVQSGPVFARIMEMCFQALRQAMSSLGEHHGTPTVVAICDNACELVRGMVNNTGGRLESPQKQTSAPAVRGSAFPSLLI
jgi:hypothetical protein